MEFTTITDYVSFLVYLLLFVIALWGAFCVILVWRRVAQTRFRTEEEQDQFLDDVGASLAAGKFDEAGRQCENDARAMPRLAVLAIASRDLGYAKVRRMVADRFQRDVLADLEYRLSWIATVVKTAPMVGLFGTVMGMMGAFGKIAGAEKVEATALAGNIQFALVTTACGLAIAIPLVLATASISVRIRKMEDLVGVGLSRFMESFKTALAKVAGGQTPPGGEGK